MAYTTINNGKLYFNTKLYTGNGSTNAITGVGFQPDWVWIKDRDNVRNHVLNDAVRGATENLFSNTDGAESTDTSTLTAFNSDGFTLGNGTKVNGSSITFASWNWKAGTSFTNDASATGIGTIDSTGSVNTTAGFSIISYTGNGSAGATIAHGLGSTPSTIFVKKISAIGDWSSYHSVLGNTGYMRLNNNNAFATASTYWNDTSPTSSVFTAGTTGNINGSGVSYIAYCFAEKQGFSKMGSYTGNGNADGPFVYTGFKPAWVMIKKTTGTNGWWGIQDNKRDPENIVDKTLYANVYDTEYSGANYYQDFLSNGFKIRTAHAGMNESAAPYIYMAFAENPFTTSTGVPATAR